jgi:hypothetical protein
MNTPTAVNGSTPDHDDRLRVGPATYTKGGYVRFGRYASGEIAMEILDEADEPQCVATVALVPYGAPHPGEYGVWLKGYSENDGVPKALVDAGIVILTGRRHPSGFSEALHAELTERACSALESHRRNLKCATDREIYALSEIGVIDAHQADELKRLITSEVIEQYDQDAMSISEIIDMYRDMTES